MRRRGIARLIELIISILIISSVFLVVYRQNTAKSINYDLSEDSRQILEEVANIESIRAEVIGTDVGSGPHQYVQGSEIYDFISGKISTDLNFEIYACQPSSVCGSSSYLGNVYTAERIISSSISLANNGQKPVKLRLFLWRAD